MTAGSMGNGKGSEGHRIAARFHSYIRLKDRYGIPQRWY